MLVLVEDAAESVAFPYVEAGGLPRIGDRWGATGAVGGRW
jgi:hypothetical protein